jgi:hypothetical protein
MTGSPSPFDYSRRTRPLAVVLARGAAAGLLALAIPLGAGNKSSLEEAAMEKFLARPLRPHPYRAHRHLEASGWGQRGWLHVETDFTLARGFHYEVTAEGGSRSIRARVLRPLLEEERRLVAEGRSDVVAISTRNYRFSPKGLAEGLVIVEMSPLRKDRALINGRLFLKPETGDLVRAEGRLARSPSFWLARVDVVRTYRRINGVVVPVRLESNARLRLPGRSILVMTYDYAEIDDRAVSDSTS